MSGRIHFVNITNEGLEIIGENGDKSVIRDIGTIREMRDELSSWIADFGCLATRHAYGQIVACQERKGHDGMHSYEESDCGVAVLRVLWRGEGEQVDCTMGHGTAEAKRSAPAQQPQPESEQHSANPASQGR